MGDVGVYFGEALTRYGFGQGHPFGPDRIHAFWQETVSRGLHKRVEVLLPQSCDDSSLLRFHTPDYLQRVKAASENGQGFLDCGDTPAFKGVFEAAATVVGSSLDAVDRSIAGTTPRIFIPIAGLHHARRDSAAGFCALNDCGVVIEALRHVYNIHRIAYVDIDAHHGDGVFYAFEQDPDLIFADIHEDGRYLYPGTGNADETGRGQASGTKLNIPLLPDADDEIFEQVWPQVEQHISAFEPEFILFQAGADSISGDPITHLKFSPAAHALAAKRLCRLADEFCNGRIIVMGGGGYNRRNLAMGWNAVLEEMVS